MTDKTDATPHSTGSEPFGYWHQGATNDESDFFLASESGDVACPDCRPLYLAAPAVQSEPSDAALIAQRDAWKAEAEHQYGRCRQANGGEDDYPVVGALDAYVAKKYAALAQPVPVAAMTDAFPVLRTGFRTTLSNGPGRRYELTIRFPTLDALDEADNELRKALK